MLSCCCFYVIMNPDNHRKRLLNDSIIGNYRWSKQWCEAEWSCQVGMYQLLTKLTTPLRKHRLDRQTRAVVFGASRLCFAVKEQRWEKRKGGEVRKLKPIAHLPISFSASSCQPSSWRCGSAISCSRLTVAQTCIFKKRFRKSPTSRSITIEKYDSPVVVFLLQQQPSPSPTYFVWLIGVKGPLVLQPLVSKKAWCPVSVCRRSLDQPQ